MEKFWENFPLAIDHDVIYNLRMVDDKVVHRARMRMRTGICIRFHHEVGVGNIIPNMLGLDSGEMKEQILAFNQTSPVDIELQQHR